jgi:tetratricopeptide (TPR) repeat protein
LPLLRRATAIHAFERRSTQVAYCFLSRSKLMLRLGRFESAAADAEQAAIVFSQAGNADGWVAAITLGAQASSARNRYDQARAVLDRAASHRSVQGKPALIGKLRLEAAEVALVAGDLGRAHEFAKDAFNRLPVALQRERAAARKLQQFVETLL